MDILWCGSIWMSFSIESFELVWVFFRPLDRGFFKILFINWQFGTAFEASLGGWLHPSGRLRMSNETRCAWLSSDLTQSMYWMWPLIVDFITGDSRQHIRLEPLKSISAKTQNNPTKWFQQWRQLTNYKWMKFTSDEYDRSAKLMKSNWPISFHRSTLCFLSLFETIYKRSIELERSVFSFALEKCLIDCFFIEIDFTSSHSVVTH